MKVVTVAWEPGAERFSAIGAHRGHSILVNAPESVPAPPGQQHRAPTGFSATELLLAGMGACAAWDVVEILRKQQQRLLGLEVRVEGEQESEPPWRYRRIAVLFTLRGRGLDSARARLAVRLSVDRYCSVIATVRRGAEVVETVEVIEATEDSARPGA